MKHHQGGAGKRKKAEEREKRNEQREKKTGRNEAEQTYHQAARETNWAMPVRFDEAGGGYSAAADRAAAAARSHSTAAHHGALQSEIAARTKRQEEAAAVAAAEAEAAAASPLMDMFSPWRFPSQPTRPRAVHIGPTTIELEWELLDGGGAVSGHQVRIDGGVSYCCLGCERPSFAEPWCLRVM